MHTEFISPSEAWYLSVSYGIIYTGQTLYWGQISAFSLQYIFPAALVDDFLLYLLAVNKKTVITTKGKSYLHERKKMYLKNDTNHKYSTDAKNVPKNWQKSKVPKMYLKSGRNQSSLGTLFFAHF